MGYTLAANSYLSAGWLVRVGRCAFFLERLATSSTTEKRSATMRRWWYWLILFSFALPAPVKAEAITVSPIGHDVVLKGDKDEILSFTVTNDTSDFADLKLSVADFGQLNDTGGVAFIGQENSDWPYRLAAWITLDVDQLLLAAGEKRTVTATINNRSDLTPGGHYAAVIVNLSDSDAQEGVGWKGMMASQFYVVKLGGEIYGLSLDEVAQPRVAWQWPNSINLHWSANGNSHVRPFGTVEIKNARGRLVSTSVINEDSALLLPGSERVLSAKVQKGKGLWPGKYYTIVNYHHQLSDEVESWKVEWWYVPLWIPTALITLALFVLIRRRHV